MKRLARPRTGGSVIRTITSGLIDQPQAHKFTGDAKIHVDFRGMPRGVKTKTSMSGMFSSIRVARGRAMPLANQDS